MPIGLAYLPAELYDTILVHLEAEATDYREFKQSLLALSRAIPRAPLYLEGLYRHIVVTSPPQASSLYLHLRKNVPCADFVQSFTYETFEANATIIVNLLALLRTITNLTLYIGPHFTPEHLEELFETPRTILKSLSLRFRPYVKKATYYQFHKGTYFDSLLNLLSAWPRASLPQLSILQDPLSPDIAPAGKFAQPLVFFKLDPISTLAASPFISTVISFRLRIPTRSVAAYLHRYEWSLPSIRYLDVATCQVTEAELASLLADLDSLQMLVLDGCPVVTQRHDALEAATAEAALAQWRALGRALAAVGVKRAKAKEKMLKQWEEQHQQQQANASNKKIRRGRRGLATATISLRGAKDDINPDGIKPVAPLPPPKVPEVPKVPVDKAGKGGRRVKGQNRSGNLDSQQAGSSTGTASTPSNHKKAAPKPTNTRVLPSPPSLRSLAITAPMASVSGKDFKKRYNTIRQEFEAGWHRGISVTIDARARLKTSWINGTVSVLVDDKPKPKGESGDAKDESDQESATGLSLSASEESASASSSASKSSRHSKRAQWRADDVQYKKLTSGLRAVAISDDFDLDIAGLDCPVLCLAGPQQSEFHPDGCPHREGWRLWQDEL